MTIKKHNLRLIIGIVQSIEKLKSTYVTTLIGIYPVESDGVACKKEKD